MNNYQIIAHRGASGYAPENTLAAFRKAYQLQVKSVEFDVVLSKDGIPIIFHDKTTTRTTNLANKHITDLSLQQIKQLDAGCWFAPEFYAEPIPTFKETLQFLVTHNMQAHIELKTHPGYETPTVTQVLAEFRATWPKNLSAIFSSFDLAMLHTLREHDSSLSLALTRRVWDKNGMSILRELDCQAMHLNALYITQQQIANLKESNYAVRCYTVDDPQHAKLLFKWGVDSIFTNYPDRFI
ncbi:MAG: glycerophosphodiester phosphodiesterase family protein [Gammaproteobacteria bacterium]